MAAFHLNGDLFSDLGLFFLPDDETEALQECAHDFQPVLPEQQESSNAVPPSTGHAEESQLVSIKQEEFSQTVPAETHLDRVRESFEYSLPPFVKHRHHSTSTSTRPPARFDRYLDDHLRLKRIIYQPSLVADLEAIADQALEDYISGRPLPSIDAAVGRSLFPDREKREDDLELSEHSRIVNERSVEEVYRRTLAHECGIVACTLMQRAALEYVNRELAQLMQYNPPTRVPDAKRSSSSPPLAPPPQMFYDKHLDANLALRRVVTIPLETYVSRAVDCVARSFKEKKIPLPVEHPRDFFPSQAFRALHRPKISITDAESLARVYQEGTASHSSVVASTLLFHFRAPGWYTALSWKAVEPPGMEDFYPFCENYALQVRALDAVLPDVRKSMDQETRTTLRDIHSRHEGLAFWEIFAISREAEDVLKDMDKHSSLERFAYECRTKGYLAPPVMDLGTPDASITGWSVPVAELLTSPIPDGPSAVPQDPPFSGGDRAPKTREPLRRSTRSRGPAASRETNTKVPPGLKKRPKGPPGDPVLSWPAVAVPAHLSVSAKAPSLSSLFIQRAWARSVQHDTTYIVFHCGNFERIGFRHRSSQTLFLSNLLDIPQCKNPGYGKIHIGLYLSILQDLIDRTKHQREQEEILQTTTRKRRRSTATNSTSNKRYKTRAMVQQERKEAEARRINHEVVKQAAAKRSLMLLEMRYGIYNSPAPASFLRLHCIRKKTYTSDEYLTVVLTSRIAAGATGVAHDAHLEVLDVDRRARRLDVVVKLAFEPEQTKRLRHEFSIYEHLASRGVVEGIPVIYGLFEDLESEAVALVMSNVGTALITLLPDDSRYAVTISQSARAGYLRVLRAIHEAGVRHRDIRPENLMLSGDEEVAFIDFDMAELDPSEGAKRREMRHLTELLDGSYMPPNQIPSAATTPEKEPAGAVRLRTALEPVNEAEGDEE
ncbi:hypothetical protein LshimejAT787_1301000 [Lyophyllum shimeji]|uniref:Protein kinase domain-containing protein n=1 Tax=Lyophyllum shimeji TaxID=47721 RepID=A0A9P3PXB5_LYOSH|nr:hypothetical protein LshimejAT787_1301000 [Lyophyllum shimeji]